jgi:hypothetical protein
MRLDELAETVRRECALADQAGKAVVLHAIAAGEALIEAQRLVPAGEWAAWVQANAPDGRGYWSCQSYMRLAALRQYVDPELTITANLRLLTGVPGRAGGSRPRVSPEVKETALAMHAASIGRSEIAHALGVHVSTVRAWTDPEWARRKEQARPSRSRVAEYRPPLQSATTEDRDPRVFRYGEPGRTAMGKAIRQLAMAKGAEDVGEALRDIAAIATAWADRVQPRYERAA